MPPRIICPHCHCPIDPLTTEAADCAEAVCRICTECDEPIVVLMPCLEADSTSPGEQQ
jgi:hypothetical protein